MTIAEVLTHDNEFKYRLLSRLEADCKYFLGFGSRCVKHLWANSVEEHIAYMFAIWNNLGVKPEWLTLAEIEAYQSQMIA